MMHRISAAILPAALALALSGCGAPPEPPKSAAKQINEAETAMTNAKAYEASGKLEQASDEYKKASTAIADGKSFAEGPERSRLRSMEDDVNKLSGTVHSKLLQKRALPEKPVAAAPVKSEDPNAAKQREEEEKKKKDEAAAATAQKERELASKIDSGTKAKNAAAEPDEPPPPPKPKEGEPAEAPKTEVAAKSKDGIFPPITDKSPPLEICKLVNKGNFVIAYIQLYNKTENGRRINSIGAIFKDQNNQPVQTQGIAGVFSYDGFNPNATDMWTQAASSITGGSHQITGLEGMRVAILGESDKASTIKKVTVVVNYLDGGRDIQTGPDSAETGSGAILKKLK